MQEFRPIEPGSGKGRQIPWAIWVAYVFSIFLYAASIVALRTHLGFKPSGEAPPLLLPILAVISAVLTLLAVSLVARWIAQKTDYLRYCLIRWAIAESIAVFGLVLMILGSTYLVGGIFLGWALSIMVFLRPNGSDERKYRDLRISRGGVGPGGS